jgi:hypothetical protein
MPTAHRDLDQRSISTLIPSASSAVEGIERVAQLALDGRGHPMKQVAAVVWGTARAPLPRQLGASEWVQLNVPLPLGPRCLLDIAIRCGRRLCLVGGSGSCRG